MGRAQMRGSALTPVLLGTSSGTLAVAGRALGNGLVREALLQGLSGLSLCLSITPLTDIASRSNLTRPLFLRIIKAAGFVRTRLERLPDRNTLEGIDAAQAADTISGRAFAGR